jgi:site-specific recombinase XerD
VLTWLEALRTRKLSDGTIRTRWRGMRRFVTWLVAEGISTSDPLAGITVDKPEAPSVPVFSDEQLAALLDACKGKTFVDLRDAAVIRLLIDCGMRVSELTGIDLDDLNLDEETVTVTGKGNKTRPAYFGSNTGLVLDRYLRARSKHRHAGNPALFLGERGSAVLDDPAGHLRALGHRANRGELVGRLAPEVGAPGVGAWTPGIEARIGQ